MDKELLHSLFSYHNGKLYWKDSKGNKKAGTIAGVLREDGYRSIKVNNKSYLAHRLVFLFHHGYLPDEVDHKIGLSNNIENLRPATHGQNQQNKPLQANNTSGFKGIGWHTASQKWQVRLKVCGKRMHFGLYHDIDYAKFVCNAMRYKYHGQFARGER